MLKTIIITEIVIVTQIKLLVLILIKIAVVPIMKIYLKVIIEEILTKVNLIF